MNTTMPYYSAKLHVVCLVDDPAHQEEQGGYICDYSIVVFRAEDSEKAWIRALELGRSQEHSYDNSDGNTVKWAFRGIEEIKELGDDPDRQEVGSVLDIYRPKIPLSFDTAFTPETHLPVWLSASDSAPCEQTNP